MNNIQQQDQYQYAGNSPEPSEDSQAAFDHLRRLHRESGAIRVSNEVMGRAREIKDDLQYRIAELAGRLGVGEKYGSCVVQGKMISSFRQGYKEASDDFVEFLTSECPGFDVSKQAEAFIYLTGCQVRRLREMVVTLENEIMKGGK